MRDVRDFFILLAIIAAPTAAMGIAAVVNASGPDSCSLYEDWSFSGDNLVVERCVGRLGMLTSERIVARY